MDPIDRLILEFCATDYQHLKPLLETISKGTLYRHVRRLVQMGWLQKVQNFYRTTEAGQRQLAESAQPSPPTSLETAYPPLRKVPTPVHQAMIALIFAAIVARQHQIRIDRHPYFVCAGETLHWKTSLGLFVCHALRLDPVHHVVDCGNESGRSLSIRRNGKGQIVFKRTLLDAPFLVLDEFSSADPSLRQPLNLFISGRMVVPFENQQITIQPVPLLTLNPKKKSTLEECLGLSAPQIRRGIMVNLDTVAMPNLIEKGEVALIAAQEHPPIILSAPTVDCQTHHRPIVQLIEKILRPEAHYRVDAQGMVNLCSGMTGLLPDPLTAITQVGYALGLLAETLNWTRPGWNDSVMAFSLASKSRPSEKVLLENLSTSPSGLTTNSPPTHLDGLPSRVSLQVPRLPREIGLPNLGLSDELRARLAWLAVETGRPLEEAVTLLLDFFVTWRGERQNLLGTFKRILELAEELQATDIDADTLQDYLHTKGMLERKGWCLEDVPECLRLIELLGSVPTHWTWSSVRIAFQAIARIIGQGLTISQVEAFLTAHHRFSKLGFDVPTAESLAIALYRAQAIGKRKANVIQRLVENADQQIDLNELRQACKDWEAKVQAVTNQYHQISKVLTQTQEHLRQLQEQARSIQARHLQMEKEYANHTSDLMVLEAFRNFLLGRTTLCDPFWIYLETLLSWKRGGGIVAENQIVGAQLIELRKKVLEFLVQLSQKTQANGSKEG